MFIWTKVDQKNHYLVGKDLDGLVNSEKCSGLYKMLVKVWFLLARTWFINASFIHEYYQENNVFINIHSSSTLYLGEVRKVTSFSHNPRIISGYKN